MGSNPSKTHYSFYLSPGFDQVVVDFKNLRVIVDEESIEKAIGVPAQGENSFKQQYFKGNYGEFLLPGFEKLN